MKIVLDTNMLLRFVDPTAPQFALTKSTLSALKSEGHALHTVPQSFYEFWVVSTRPVANNGLGFSTQKTGLEMVTLEAIFPLLNDTPALFDEWRKLVELHDCKGKVAHDARLVAAMQTQGITHLLTFNVGDFARFPGVIVLDPAAVVAPAIP